MNVEIVNNEIIGRIEIKAPPERVFQALTHPEEWWGAPGVYRVLRSSMELRPGGAWISEGESEDGARFHVKGTVVECDPPALLAYTWKPSWEENVPETTVTFTMESIEGGTLLRLRHGSFDKHDESSKSHYDGWAHVLSWLQAYCER